MFGSVMLDVAIGLILVYLILSLACTALREGFESLLRDRASFLHRGIDELLHDPTLTKDLYEHPLVSSLYKSPYVTAKASRDLPSYIPSRSFALALLDMAARGRDTTSAGAAGPGATPLTVSALRQNISQIKNPKVQRVLLSALDVAGNDLAAVQHEIETWFNSSMDRVSGWYKRRTQWVLMALGLAIAGVVNVDTIRLAESFYNDPSQRAAAVAMAGSVLKSPPGGTSDTAGAKGVNAAEVAQVWTHLQDLSLPIGWPDSTFARCRDRSAETVGCRVASAGMRMFGWLLTGLAVTLGAPFWFDLLGKVMTVRSALKPGTKGSSKTADSPPTKSDTTVTVVSAPAASPVTAPPPIYAGGGGGGSVASPSGGAAAVMAHPGDDYRPHEWSSGHGESGVI